MNDLHTLKHLCPSYRPGTPACAPKARPLYGHRFSNLERAIEAACRYAERYAGLLGAVMVVEQSIGASRVAYRDQLN